MATTRRDDVWAAGDLYEPYVGRWSRAVAKEFLAWLALSTDADWLDVGCGTGALTRTIAENTHPRSVIGVDRSAGFVAHAQAHIGGGAVRFETGDAEALPLATSTVDAAVSGLVLNFVPRPAQAIAEMTRVARPGGTVALYVWDYAERMELMRYFWDAAIALDPAARDLDEGIRFPLCRPEPLAELFTQASLRDVETRAIDVPTVFRDFDDYWSPFLGGQGPAPGYAMAQDETKRNALKERIHAMLPIAADGTIPLTARAWAVRGHTP
jgi:SAM-dependent methyltransferase